MKPIAESSTAWIYDVFTIEIRKLVSYRIDFWIHFAGNVITQIGLAYFLWKSVFEFTGRTTMGGYDFLSLMLYYLMVPLVDRTVRGPEMRYVAQEIYEGTLTRYLIFPVQFFIFKYVTHLAHSFIFLLQFVVAVGVFIFVFGRPDAFHPTLLNTAMGLFASLAATLLYYYIAMLVEMFAFWADHVWSLMVLLRMLIFFTGGGMIPLSFFPEWILPYMKVLPFQFLTSFPIRTFSGQVGLDEYLWGMGLVVLWVTFFGSMAQLVWRRGLLRYTGVGI